MQNKRKKQEYKVIKNISDIITHTPIDRNHLYSAIDTLADIFEKDMKIQYGLSQDTRKSEIKKKYFRFAVREGETKQETEIGLANKIYYVLKKAIEEVKKEGRNYKDIETKALEIVYP